MLKTVRSTVNVDQITGVLPVVNGGTGVTTSTGTGNTVLSAAPTLSGNVTLSTGNLIVANGQGIDFSATPGTGTSELLNDYEEGTWTPVANSLTVVGSPTYSANYTKTGRLVTLHLVINPSTSTTSIAGTTNFTGLPFAPAGTTTSTAGSVADVGTVNLGSCAIYAPPTAALYTPGWSANTNAIAVTITYSV